jgi:ketosteroid isomerase-like protein
MAGAGHALEQALAYYRAPAMLAAAAQRPLPEDVLVLLRLAAGDAGQAALSAEACGESPRHVAEAAVFFVQQVMFAPEADPHRVLGVNPGAPAARIREHYRWLVRWLHPDRNADDWDSVYTDRVTRAWQSLRRSGALAGDGEAAEADGEPGVRGGSPPFAVAAPTVLAATRRAHIPHAEPAAPMLSARTARRLPVFVMGGLGLVAVSLVALLWYAQQRPVRPRPVAERAAPVPVASDRASDPAAASAADVFGPEDPPALAAGPGLAQTEPAPALPATPMPAPAPPLPPATATAPTPTPVQAVATLASPSPPAAAGEASVPTARPVPAATRPAAPKRPDVASARVAPEPPASAAMPTVGRVDPGSVAIATDVPPAENPEVLAAATPAAAKGDTGDAALADASLDEAAAHAVLARFTEAYAAGDINALMRLFTRDAVNNRGGRAAIVYDYQSLFSQTRERHLALVPNAWIVRGDSALVLAGYEAWVKEGRLRPATTTRGDIRFTLRREDGELKISQVMHD